MIKFFVLIIAAMQIILVQGKCKIGKYEGKYKLGVFPDMCNTCNVSKRFECLVSNYGNMKCAMKHEISEQRLSRLYATGYYSRSTCDSFITQYKYRDEIDFNTFISLRNDCYSLFASTKSSFNECSYSGNPFSYYFEFCDEENKCYFFG
ncbi:hypothetical protein PIROE2DRAFT_16504 [Piromyces sp. E2]|nr:hypothetical protein PIROE2DRAFT_16504 [Piromyces sp. E2]|eukprot:OUM58272.1 hypothetical protein PIROE2DRAFT_16504 [Piromyces sp. E2]